MKILIADDHALLREGLKQILIEEFSHAIFGESESVPDTLALLSKHPWDVLLLDLFMPGGNGLEILREATSNHPQIAVLVLSSAPEEQIARRVLQLGAAGFLNKQTAPEQLIQAVRKILSGGCYVSATLAERLAGEIAQHSHVVLPHETLSDREFQVFQLLVAGKSVKVIASELHLSPKTVSTFHTRLLEKLHLQNDVQLVHYAIEHRLIEGPSR